MLIISYDLFILIIANSSYSMKNKQNFTIALLNQYAILLHFKFTGHAF